MPNSAPVPIEELEEIFEQDVEDMTENMLKNFNDRTLCLTIQQLDALILYRFQTGTLGSTITTLVESRAPKSEWDKVITNASTERRKAVKTLYWGDIFDYEDACMD